MTIISVELITSGEDLGAVLVELKVSVKVANTAPEEPGVSVGIGSFVEEVRSERVELELSGLVEAVESGLAVMLDEGESVEDGVPSSVVNVIKVGPIELLGATVWIGLDDRDEVESELLSDSVEVMLLEVLVDTREELEQTEGSVGFCRTAA